MCVDACVCSDQEATYVSWRLGCPKGHLEPSAVGKCIPAQKMVIFSEEFWGK